MSRKDVKKRVTFADQQSAANQQPVATTIDEKLQATVEAGMASLKVKIEAETQRRIAAAAKVVEDMKKSIADSEKQIAAVRHTIFNAPFKNPPDYEVTQDVNGRTRLTLSNSED